MQSLQEHKDEVTGAHRQINSGNCRECRKSKESVKPFRSEPEIRQGKPQEASLNACASHKIRTAFPQNMHLRRGVTRV